MKYTTQCNIKASSKMDLDRIKNALTFLENYYLYCFVKHKTLL